MRGCAVYSMCVYSTCGWCLLIQTIVVCLGVCGHERNCNSSLEGVHACADALNTFYAAGGAYCIAIEILTLQQFVAIAHSSITLWLYMKFREHYYCGYITIMCLQIKLWIMNVNGQCTSPNYSIGHTCILQLQRIRNISQRVGMCLLQVAYDV